MKMILTLFFLLSVSCSFGQVSLQEIALDNGSYQVGFKHYITHDSSRSYQRIYDWNNEVLPRPIPISIWYPAATTTSTPKMKVLDYMRILKEEEEWEHLPDEFILNWFYYPDTPENQKHLDEQTTAHFNASAHEGPFPVIIYAPSYQASSIENFGLCEFLASHGYVVISSPSRGADNRYFEGGTLKDAETQARDIQFLVSIARSLAHVDPKRMASIGFSFGGLSNVLAYAQNKDIKAIVSLDGSIKYQFKTIENSPFFDINDFDIPFLHLSQKDIPMEVMMADGIDTTLNHRFDFFDQLTHSRAYHFKFNDLTHSYFSTLGVLFQPRDSRQDKPDREIMKSYKWVSEYTLNFLNACLLENSATKNWISNNPDENGIRVNAITKVASKTPDLRGFTFQDFNEKAAEGNYQDLEQLYKEVIGDNPNFEIPEGRLNNLGLQLLFNPATSESGIKVLLFATNQYPSSANLFDSLGEAYLFVGDKENALTSFRRSLDLDPGNQNAIKRISELSK